MRDLVFEDSLRRVFSVHLDEHTGSGSAIMIADRSALGAVYVTLEVHFKFDPSPVWSAHDSYLAHAAIYGPNRDQPLDQILGN